MEVPSGHRLPYRELYRKTFKNLDRGKSEMQTDPRLRTCRISEKLVRFLMFFEKNGYRGGNRRGTSVTDKKGRFLI